MEVDQVETTRNVPLIHESVVDFWECIPRDWPDQKYDVALVDELDELLRTYGETYSLPMQRVLDCGCGTGNPSIGLAKKGYQMFCVDADPSMVERFKLNCAAASVDVPVITYDWRDLNGELEQQGPFDAAICRGNSLIYAGCWERAAFIPQVASQAIATSLKHIASVIRLGGLFYVDITSAEEYADLNPKTEFVGVRETAEHTIIVYWLNEYVPETRTRYVLGRRLFERKGRNTLEFITTHAFTSYMLYHNELLQLAAQAGFTPVTQIETPRSELFYDVFVFRKDT